MTKAAQGTIVISINGRITLPKAVRERLNWQPGTRLVVEDTGHGVVLKPFALFPRSRIEDVFGCLSYKGAPKTIEEMNAGIAAEVNRRYLRSRRKPPA